MSPSSTAILQVTHKTEEFEQLVELHVLIELHLAIWVIFVRMISKITNAVFDECLPDSIKLTFRSVIFNQHSRDDTKDLDALDSVVIN